MNKTAIIIAERTKDILPFPFAYQQTKASKGEIAVIPNQIITKTIHAPVIQEAFINMECTLKTAQDLSGAGITSMVIGQVQHISVDKKFAQGYERRYGKDGFMMLVPAPQDLVTGEPNQSAIATINIEKYD